MRVLLIDNYDSYTWNLCHLIASVNDGASAGAPPCPPLTASRAGEPPVVLYNDELSWAELEDVLAAGHFDAGHVTRDS